MQAAPILVSREHLGASAGRARAIVINSGNANACTGAAGLVTCRRTVSRLAGLLELPETEVLVASTGVIGEHLLVETLLSGLPLAVKQLDADGGAAAAEAILTTDTCAKEAVLAAGGYTIGGMSKGSGMIHPDMATTLGIVTTDADVEPGLLQQVLGRAVDRSFNRISVDGDTSTNDMVAVLANGASGVKVPAGGVEEELFKRSLTRLLVELARAVARDGEGASRLITVRVSGARTEDDALQVSRTVSSSPLVKTAIHGADANWGRIVAAAGRSGVGLDPERMTILIGDVKVLEPGYVSRFSEAEVAKFLNLDEVVLTLEIGQGEAEATTWTCDLSARYVEINASYRT